MPILFTLPKTIFTSKNPSLPLSLQRQHQHQHHYYHHPSHHPLPSLLCFIILCKSSAHFLIYLVVTFHSWNVISIPINHQHIKVPLVNCKYSRWYWRNKYKNERVPTYRQGQLSNFLSAQALTCRMQLTHCVKTMNRKWCCHFFYGTRGGALGFVPVRKVLHHWATPQLLMIFLSQCCSLSSFPSLGQLYSGFSLKIGQSREKAKPPPITTIDFLHILLLWVN